jgi:actin-related protein
MQANREIIAKILFKEFNVPALYIANTSALALFAAGRVTGVVVESGLSLLPCFLSSFHNKRVWCVIVGRCL